MEVFGVTDTGKIRRNNQDCFLTLQTENVCAAVVCDGMGGARAGQTASAIASSVFMSHMQMCTAQKNTPLSLETMIKDAAQYANIKVYDRAYTDRNCRGMGTTLVAAAAAGDRLTVVNIGDSRAYLISGDEIRQITEDHSYVQELVKLGEITPEEARTHPRKNIITRSVGSRIEVESDVFTCEIHDGDIVLLCSDGVSNLIEDAELLDIIRSENAPDGICRRLIDISLERGAPDNVTAVALLV